MKTRIVSLLGFGLCLTFAGCSTVLTERLGRADGLLEFLFDRETGPSDASVHVVSGAGGTVETAHVRSFGGDVFVSGLIGRGMHESSLGSHLDILVFNGSGELQEAHVVDFLPHPIQSGRRGASYSRYAVRLWSRPQLRSTIRVVFHNEAKATCSVANTQASVRAKRLAAAPLP